jgi:hypothetical protein
VCRRGGVRVSIRPDLHVRFLTVVARAIERADRETEAALDALRSRIGRADVTPRRRAGRPRRP